MGKTKSFMGVSNFKKEGQKEYRWNFSTVPKRTNLNNPHNRLVLTQGREPRQDGGVTQEKNSPMSRSVEDTPSEYTHLPKLSSNYCRHNITKVKESNKYDLCRILWTSEGRFNTEDDLLIQTLLS